MPRKHNKMKMKSSRIKSGLIKKLRNLKLLWILLETQINFNVSHFFEPQKLFDFIGTKLTFLTD